MEVKFDITEAGAVLWSRASVQSCFRLAEVLVGNMSDPADSENPAQSLGCVNQITEA
jgi:hypothetical protein